jgi:tetratricopeptide (TPR) repeat protein
MRGLINCVLLIFAFSTSAIGQDVLKKGIELIQNENYAEAQKFFNDVAAKDPKNGTAHYYLGQISYLLEEYPAASASFSKGLLANSKCIECQIGLEKMNLDGGKALEVDKSLEKIAKSNKKSPSILAMIGDVYLSSKKFDALKAIDFFTRSRDIDPKNANVWGKLGDAHKLKGDSGSAMSAYESAAEKDPTNLEVVMKMADIWAKSGQLDLAIQKLENAIKLSPNYAPAYKLMYELYLKARQYTKMIPALEKYSELAGNDVKARERLVKFVVYTAKDYDRGIEKGNQLIKDFPNEYTAYRWLAWSYGEKEMYKESLESSKRLFEEIAKDTSRKSYQSDYEYFAKAAFKLGEIDQAIDAYKKVIEFEPNKAEEIWGTIAKSFYDKTPKDYANAIKFFKMKNDVKPLGATDSYYLGTSYFTFKDYVNAQAVFEKLVALSPNTPLYWHFLARSADRQEANPTAKTGLAKAHFSKLVEVGKADPVANKRYLIDAYEYLAAFAYSANDLPTAILNTESIIAIDPTNANAQNNLTVFKAGGGK